MTVRRYFALALVAGFFTAKAIVLGATWLAALCGFMTGFCTAAAMFCVASRAEIERLHLAQHVRK